MAEETIAITGGIGSGKSVVSRILRCNGFPVFDCDYEAKLLMTKDTKIKSALEARYGEGIYLPDGSLNRPRLAEIIFSDTKERSFVNSIVHKEVRENILQCRKETKGYFFVETAIPTTGKLGEMSDEIWLVEAPLSIRLERVMERDGSTPEQVEARIRSQVKEFAHLPKGKTVGIMNDGRHPVITEVLKRTSKYNNQQTYILTC